VILIIAAVDPAIAQTPQAHHLFVDAVALLGTAGEKRRLLGALNEHDQLVVAFVGRDHDGVTVDGDWNVLGQRATRGFLRDNARPFFEAVRGGWAQKASEDPHSLLRYGRLATRVRAAEAILGWAARELTEIGLNPRDDDDEAAARASLAVTQAKAFGSEVAVTVSSELFALAGASAAEARYDLDRHWRNARTLSIHDPADWKYHHVAQYEVNGVLPPNHAQL
jgi:alkylation response protein AidB-like acyl-CoA dehydrogenase